MWIDEGVDSGDINTTECTPMDALALPRHG